MNASLIWSVVDAYNDLMEVHRDRRVDGKFLMSSPIPTLLICAAYVYFVTSLGPKLMRNRPAFELKTAIVIYNAVQVVFSIYLVYEFLVHAWLWRYSFRCQPVNHSADDPDELVVVQMCWLYFMCKFTEFLDTIFFVMRKKFDQITHLHVIHHTIMPACSWWGVRFLPSGHATLFVPINTFIHILMYAYYLVAAMGPKYQKYLWWKKYLTTLQMIQFAVVFFHTLQLFFIECNYPIIVAYAVCFNAALFMVLFSNFYIQAYIKRRRLPPAKMLNDGEPLKSSQQHRINGIHSVKKAFNEAIIKASGACSIDQNGLYKANKSFKKEKDTKKSL